MKRQFTRITAFTASLVCLMGMAACGNDVPADESESSELSISSGVAENTTGNVNDVQTSDVTTSAAENETAGGTTTVSGAGFVAVTRAGVASGASKPNGNINTPTTKTPGNNAGGNTAGAGNNGGGNSNAGGNNGGGAAVSGITLSYTSAEISVGQTKQYPVVSENINEVWTSSNTAVATVDSIGNITGVGEGTCIIKVTSADNPSLGAQVSVTVKKSEGSQQIDGVTYIDGILIANKTYGLPASYNPGGLTGDTYSAFQELASGAANDGLNIYISSGFRSYETQEAIYNDYVATNGQAVADTFSARPGFSEHQTGLAIDVNEISDAFIGTPEAIWLEEHCVEYGFIIRYPQGKQGVTGYKYEPWHIRYVGKDNAKRIHDAAVAAGDPYLTLEEYFGITSAYQ